MKELTQTYYFIFLYSTLKILGVVALKIHMDNSCYFQISALLF